MDRATQVEVGLFNGLPMWYRRAQAVELRTGTPLVTGSSATVSGSAVSGNGQESGYGSSSGSARRGGYVSGMSWRGSMRRNLAETGRQGYSSPVSSAGT
jgi:hypothetical protein